MAEKHHLEKDGVLSDGVGLSAAGEEEKELYNTDREELAKAGFQVPALFDSNREDRTSCMTVEHRSEE